MTTDEAEGELDDLEPELDDLELGPGDLELGPESAKQGMIDPARHDLESGPCEPAPAPNDLALAV